MTAALAWSSGWVATTASVYAGASPAAAVAGGLAIASTPAVLGRTVGVDTVTRRAIVVAGFPLLLLATGLAAGLPAWLWILPLALLLVAYPVTAWQDAPVFPTPAGALSGLPARLSLPDQPRIHDAGCGLGHGLRALRAAWPDARVSGIEYSRPFAWFARLRCPWARVSTGDLWRQTWGAYDVVYLFQRPESMARAMAKAESQMAEGSWLVSLEFEVPGRIADVTLVPPPGAAGRVVRAYRIGRSGTRAAKKGLKFKSAAPITEASP